MSRRPAPASPAPGDKPSKKPKPKSPAKGKPAPKPRKRVASGPPLAETVLPAPIVTAPAPDAPKVRLIDLARIAGVSAMTISLALRNSPRISSAQRQRIQKIAQAAGYHRDSRMDRLMAIVRNRKTRHDYQVMALVYDFAKEAELLSSPWETKIVRGATARAIELGYRLQTFWLRQPGMTSERMTRILFARGVEAMLILSQGRHAHSSLGLSRFATATVGYTLYRPELHRACVNIMQGIFLATRKLGDMGYRRIGLVTTPIINARSGYTYSAAMHQYQIQSVDPADRVPHLEFNTDNMESRKKSFMVWMRKHRPDVVIAYEVNVPDWIRELGLRIPEDIGFVQHDWTEAHAEFAGLDHRRDEVSAAAVDLIDEQLRHGRYGIPAIPRMVLIPPAWVDGPSLRDRRHP